MSYSVYTTSAFVKELKGLSKKHLSVKADMTELINEVAQNPFLGQSLGRDCYKLRMSITSKNKGKRSGARVIICVKIVHGHVYLLSVYDKSEKSTISEDELTMLLEAAGL